jgi:hypothetical protein
VTGSIIEPVIAPHRSACVPWPNPDRVSRRSADMADALQVKVTRAGQVVAARHDRQPRTWGNGVPRPPVGRIHEAGDSPLQKWIRVPESHGAAVLRRGRKAVKLWHKTNRDSRQQLAHPRVRGYDKTLLLIPVASLFLKHVYRNRQTSRVRSGRVLLPRPLRKCRPVAVPPLFTPPPSSPVAREENRTRHLEFGTTCGG